MIKVGDMVKLNCGIPYVLHRLGFNKKSIFKVKAVNVGKQIGRYFLTFENISDRDIFGGLNANDFDIVKSTRKSRIESLKL